MVADVFEHMGRHGISADEGPPTSRNGPRRTSTSLFDELNLIADAGFPHPDCFWREGLIAVYGAFKNG